MEIHLKIFVLLLLLYRIECVHFVVVAPNVMRWDTEEKVIVTLEGKRSANVELYMQDLPHERNTFSVKWRENAGNGKAEEFTMKVRVADFPDLGGWKENKLVRLRAKVGNGPSYRFYSTDILMTSNIPNVFVQTDKPLYTPEQQVLISVYTTDLDNVPKKMPIRLDLVSPTGMSVDRKELMTEYYTTKGSTMQGMYRDKFVLPRSPVHGNWSVVASYGPKFTENTTAIFEVKEYVLPSFSCTLHDLNNFIYKGTDESFSGTVKAEYNHGKAMRGTVKIRFGIVDEKRTIYFLTKNMTLRNGMSDFHLNVKEKIYKKFDFDTVLKDKRLMVHATCFETATGDMQEVKNSQAFFVITPFIFNFEQTRTYFKPGLTTVVQFQLLYKNGQPAGNKELEIMATAIDKYKQESPLTLYINDDDGSVSMTTDERGWIRCQYNPPGNVRKIELEFKVPRSDKSNEKEKVLHEEKLTLDNKQLNDPSKDIAITFDSHSNKPLPTHKTASIRVFFTGTITELTWLVLSRGRILSSDKVTQSGGFGNNQVLRIPITKEMVPNARLVVFFLSSTGVVGGDSLWIDVEDKCQDQDKIPELKVMDRDTPVTDADPIKHSKYKQLRVAVEWTQHARVALQMVDRAVHTLNDRTTLTPESMWSQLNALDTGCGGGGGENTGQMFSNAGLAVTSSLKDTSTNVPFNTKARTTYKCTTKHARTTRTRRQAEDTDSSVLDLADCCALGTEKAGDWMGCETVVKSFMWPAEDDVNTYTVHCLNVIKECCRNASSQPVTHRPTDDEQSNMRLSRRRRSGYQEEEELIAAANEVIRKSFPESMWLRVAELGENGEGFVDFTMPDTITSWAVEAVGLHATSGLCVLPSTQFTVKKDQYIKVRLPYRAVRGEHLNARVTFYNFDDEATAVGIYMRGVDGVCSKALPGRLTKKVSLHVCEKAAKTISFPIVPMKVGVHRIVFYAVRGRHSILDSVAKTLTVVAEGVTKTIQETFLVEVKPNAPLAQECTRRPTDRGQNEVKCEVLIGLPKYVPGSLFGRIRIVGNMFGAAADIVLNDLSKALQQPWGCAEQTMVALSQGVYAYKYMNRTNSMTPYVLGKLPNIVTKAKTLLAPKHKDNGGFSVWNHTPPKVWLTSFIIKVFSAANEFVPKEGMDERTLNKAVIYVYNQQMRTGSQIGKFYENSNDGKLLKFGTDVLLGAVSGDDLTLTAYIAAAMCEADPNQLRKIHRENINKTFDYLAYNVQRLTAQRTTAYEKALVAYALSFSTYQKTASEEAFRRLKQAAVDASYDKGSMVRYFYGGSKAKMIETVAYAILTALRHEEFEYCYPMVLWLHTQRTDGGNIFSSTQDTVMALQALAEYAIAMERGRTDISVYVDGAQDKTKESFTINENSKNREFIVELTKDKVLDNHIQPFFVTASGQGVMQVAIEIQYNTEGRPPSGFDVVVVKNFKKKEKVLGGGAVGECGEATGVDFDSEGYYNPFAVDEEETVTITIMEMTIKAKCKACGKTGMAIIEVGLLSGFTADKNSLEELLKDQSIDSYEVTDATVIMYLTAIREDRESIVSFSAIQENKVDHISPAVIKIYDYYNRSNNYMDFYNGSGIHYYNESGIPILGKDSFGNEGVCVGRCSKCYGLEQSELLPIEDLKKNKCTPSITYAYVVKVLGRNDSSPDFVKTTVEIQRVAKKDKENVSQSLKITLSVRTACDCPTLDTGKDYFIYGKDEPQLIQGVGYILPVNSDTYVEPLNLDRIEKFVATICMP